MPQAELIARRFAELERQMSELRKLRNDSGVDYYPVEQWEEWATSVENLLGGVFGRQSVQYGNFRHIHDTRRWATDIDRAKGVFKSAKADYEGGYIFNVVRQVSGEIFGDFVGLAKQSLAAGSHEVAVVLASAALEDALKRYATDQGVDVEGKVMQQVVAALKAKGLVSGAQKSLLDAMPKIRDFAMHAEWQKITPADASGVVAFVEQFLLAHF